jgi:hypothetical protein
MRSDCRGRNCASQRCNEIGCYCGALVDSRSRRSEAAEQSSRARREIDKAR